MRSGEGLGCEGASPRDWSSLGCEGPELALGEYICRVFNPCFTVSPAAIGLRKGDLEEED